MVHVALGAGEAGRLEQAQVMGDQPLVAPDDPGKVANAGGLAGLEGKRDGEPGRVAERLRPGRPQLQFPDADQLPADALGLGKIETAQIASFGFHDHRHILQTFA